MGKFWFPVLGLDHWRIIGFEYQREGKPDKPDAVAEVVSAWDYQHATIFIYCPAWIGISDDEAEYFFVHECCHMLVNEMRCWSDMNISAAETARAKEHEERVVTNLAVAFIRARKSE